MLRFTREIARIPATNINLFGRKSFSHTNQEINDATIGLTAIQSFFRHAISNETISKQQAAEIASIEQTTVKHYQQSRKYQSGVQANIDSLVKNTAPYSPANVRLATIALKMRNNPVRPVITSHPTRVKSNFAIFTIQKIVSSAIKLDENSYDKEENKILRREIWANCQRLVAGPFLQATKLTPRDEAEYGHFVFTKMIEPLPIFKKMLINSLHAELGLEKSVIEQTINSDFIRDCIDLRSWVKGDADGNSNTTAESMSETVPTHQTGMLRVYLAKTSEIMQKIKALNATNPSEYGAQMLANLQSSLAYYQRCIDSINAEIWFNEAGSDKAVKVSVAKLNIIKEYLLSYFPDSDKTDPLIDEVDYLIDIIKIAKFTGGMREYVRQTTELNTRVFNNIFDIVAKYSDPFNNSQNDSYISSFLKFNKLFLNDDGSITGYSDLPIDKKMQFQRLLSNDPTFFQLLAKKQDEFTPETAQEFKRLSFIARNKSLFPYYICSNTETKNNFNEVAILMGFAKYMIDGNLYIGQINSFVVNMMFLVESPKDMQNLGTILDDIFRDPHMRSRISQSGFISCVLGPSDLGKEGGVGTHISLYFGRLLCKEKLIEYQEKFPELRHVKFLFLNGYGSDYKRRIQRSGKQSHATFQGISAYLELGAPFAFLDYLSANIGREPQSDVRVQEIVNLRSEKPELYSLLQRLEQYAVPSYEEFIKQPAVKKLLESLTDLTVEDRLNISSRAASKAQSKKDVTKLRAIGVVNVYIYMLLNFDIFMGVHGWDKFTSEDNQNLHDLYRQSGVVQDIVHKVLFSLVISDFDRAWKLLNNGVVPSAQELAAYNESYLAKSPEDRTPAELLAYIYISADLILRNLMLFAPPSKQLELNAYLQAETTTRKSVSSKALDLMEIIGGEYLQLARESRLILGDAQQLATLIDEYTQNRTDHNLEAVVRGIRAGNSGLFWGPDSIADRRVGVIPEDNPSIDDAPSMSH